MGFVFGFAPWIVYWILVGNVAFRTAVLVALALAVVAAAVSRWRSGKWHSLEVGTVAVFAAITVLAFTVNDHFLERWLQPIGNAGIFLVALVGVLVGRPFVRDYAEASVDAATAGSDGFRVITTAMTWMWVAVFGAMTALSLIPPLRQGEATIRDGGSTLSILCYWVLPFTLMGLAGAVSGAFPPWFDKQSAAIDAQQAKATELAPMAQPTGVPEETSPGLVIDAPSRSRHDEPFAATVTVDDGRPITLTVEGADLYGRDWRFSGDDVATVDSSAIWRMGNADGELFVAPEQPWRLHLTATVGDRRTTRTVVREPIAAGVTVEQLEVAGRPALVARPARRIGTAVACFGGSEGGVDSQRATIEALASRGHIAMAVGWLDEGAASVADIPLRRFADPITWLRGHVGSDRVAAVAISRGSEGLAAAAALGDLPLSRLVLISPSSVMWQAIGGDGDVPDTGSWVGDGGPVPWAPLPDGALMPQLVGNAWRHTWSRTGGSVRPLRLLPAYSAGLSRGVPDDAVIATEKIDCPILCLSGTDDALWPSGEMAEALLARRKRAGDRHIAYPGAGHLIRLGVYPATDQTVGGIALGGEPEGHGRACLAAVDEVVGFLGG
ncbi:acyl-CoA thioester hydrolase/BAAT C-terminal domain-containing protein [Gordonia sp. (in: high G+C Gram-positive bacteria)]|uniref:acyl-CoA thioester hydrolase/BAAT C-terminal domain-containing protein n=1 Tax=Gordonia sp. (in: high G+C Gram-positive bacteria) TaxID=84139 RepID=UPI0039E70DD3